MRKEDFNSRFRAFVKENISPTNCNGKKCRICDTCLVSSVYNSFIKILNHKCIQIGSYPRFTSIRPLHDLDILYILDKWDEHSHSPQQLLEELSNKIHKEYQNPTSYQLYVSLQTHSVTVIFKENNEEVFSVDVIPAYIFSKNEFSDDTYKVPEIIKKKHYKNRISYYETLKETKKEMDWIITDPRGYIEIARQLNEVNDDFRKTVKFVKSWKSNCKEKLDDFELKSFHIEQVITKYFIENNNLDLFSSIFKFFTEIPQTIEKAQIIDRANHKKYIDGYLNDLTNNQKKNIVQARDGFLIKLEDFKENGSVEELLKSYFYRRASNTEAFLFDQNIPVLIDNDYEFNIDGFVQEKKGYRHGWLSMFLPRIEYDRKIKFKIKGKSPDVDLFKWKVKNDNNSEEPRGEITDHQTKSNPEYTKFAGNHYVECYAIENDVCVYRAKCNVPLGK